MSYSDDVNDVSVRELRNHTSAVLRRVEAGERVRVTVDRRPVAELGPLTRRPVWAPAAEVWAAISGARADSALLDDLRPLREQTLEDEWPARS